MSDPGTASGGPTGTPRWGDASDLSRLVPDGSLERVEPAPGVEVGEAFPTDRLAGFAVVTPPVRPRPTSGLNLSPTARVLLGVAIAAMLGFMVWNAWQNVSGL